MTIKEIEQITGLTRSNIRFYEKEKLISPDRNENNGYREYTTEDVTDLNKIAYLRTLGISIEDIRKISNKEADLFDVIKTQKQILEHQLSELENAKIMCERMLSSKERIDYEHLDIEQYVTNPKEYWNQNSSVFKLDSIRFFYIWGGNIVWAIITFACLFAAVFSFRHLPAEIPVQWSGGIASLFVDKKCIFTFPVICLIIRFLLRPFIWRWFKMNIIDSDSITDYIVNFLCFVTLSVEIFIILFVKEIIKHVTVILFIDTVVLIGLLLIAIYRAARKKQQNICLQIFKATT